MTEQFSFGLIFFLCGLALALLNKPVAQLNKKVDELFGMGSFSFRMYQIGNIIAGSLLAILGALFLLNIARIK